MWALLADPWVRGLDTSDAPWAVTVHTLLCLWRLVVLAAPCLFFVLAECWGWVAWGSRGLAGSRELVLTVCTLPYPLPISHDVTVRCECVVWLLQLQW